MSYYTFLILLKQKKYLLNLFLLLMSPSLSLAEDEVNEPIKKKAWIECAHISNNALRLACYDKIYSTDLPPTLKESKLINQYSNPSKSISPKIFNQDRTADSKIFTSSVPLSSEDAKQFSPLSTQYDLDQNDSRGILSIREHKPSYIIPVWYNNKDVTIPNLDTQRYNYSDLQNIGTKFSLSFKTKIWEDILTSKADLWFAYTQISYWQSYNRKWSAPFIEHNYSPEIFVTQPIYYSFPYDIKLRMIGGGFIHESNGQSGIYSRSWNRLYAMLGIEKGNLTIIPKIWWKIPEKNKESDNPDIIKYRGYGEIFAQYQLKDKQSISANIHYNPASGKGNLRLNYAYPIAGNLKIFIQAFTGYGENLIDYNKKQNSVGIGFIFDNWSGL